jgi:hypothetical protein
VQLPPLQLPPVDETLSQSALVQQLALAMQLLLVAQYFWPAPQPQVLLTQVAVPPPQSAGVVQQPVIATAAKPQAPVVQVRVWQALPVGHSLAAQHPVDATQVPSAEQYLSVPPQVQVLPTQVAPPLHWLEALQQPAAPVDT